MTITVTLKGALLTAIAVLVIIFLIYLIILLNNLIKTIKQTNLILDDAKVVSATAAEKAEQIDGIVSGIGSSVGTVVNSIKGNQSVVSAATSVVNAASSFAGIVKKDKKNKKNK
ncbi:MAG: hypothetical protein IKU67_05830 [Firmicutes bacterium]|nr:hypothetical protein [Bacillota bacterium]